jgi:hypothetical protein
MVVGLVGNFDGYGVQETLIQAWSSKIDKWRSPRATRTTRKPEDAKVKDGQGHWLTQVIPVLKKIQHHTS